MIIHYGEIWHYGMSLLLWHDYLIWGLSVYLVGTQKDTNLSVKIKFFS